MLFRVVSACFGLFRFVSKQFVSVVSNYIPKQQALTFRLNRNKQKTNRNSLIESIFWHFKEKFKVVFSVCFGLIRDSSVFSVVSIYIGAKHRNKPKILVFGFTKQTERVSVCFGLIRNSSVCSVVSI